MDASSGPRRVFMMAEFTDPETLLEATRRIRALGHEDLDTHTPYPVHGLSDALGLKPSRVPLFTFFAGVTGATLGYLMQYWMNAVDYPINVGGRPPHSPPTNLPITFECGILGAALATILVLLFYYCRFPQPYHPVFEVEAFRRATLDRFWLSVAGDKVDDQVMETLGALGASHTAVVEET